MIHRNRLALAVLFVALLIEAALTGLIPLSLRFFADYVWFGRDRDALFFMLGILTGGVVLAAFAGLTSDYLAARVVSRSLAALRQRMFERRGIPGAAGLYVVESALWQAVPRAVLPGLEAFFCALLMLWLDWRVGLAALLLWPWIILVPGAAAVRVKLANALASDERESLVGIARENLAARSLLRAFSLDQTGIGGFRNRNDSLSRRTMHAVRLSSFMGRITGIGSLALRAVLLALGGWLVLGNNMTIGVFAALPVLTYQLCNSLLSVIRFVPSLSGARIEYARIGGLLNTPADVQEAADALPLPPMHSEIGLSDVRFSYGEHECIAGITARIPRGASVAFVGPGGAGKSTLVGLLMRFHDPRTGHISIDGHDLKAVTQASLRSRMGVVLQENPLLNMSIRDNFRVGKPDASEEAVTRVAHEVGLHDLIAALPQGYDSLAGEGGVRFSAGGTQRLAIARVLLREPEILILDEANSALDPVEEAGVKEILNRVRKGRTVIAMSHRLSTVADADHIFVIEKGAIVEQGSHAALLAADGVYARAWRKQGGFVFSPDGRHAEVAAERLKAIPAFGQLAPAALSELAALFATETFQPGREIVRQGDPGDRLRIIARGEVEVRTAGGEATVLQDGDVFGESALHASVPCTATLRALTVCTCISLERARFNGLLERVPLTAV